MRVSFISLSILLTVAVAVNGDSISLNGQFKVADPFLDVMNSYFEDSFNYLFTSKQYESQYVQRPGMSKFLKEASDFGWEEGIEFLKKFLQRKGRLNDFRKKLDLTSLGELTMSSSENRFQKYSMTIDNLLQDAVGKFEMMNNIFSSASVGNQTHAADHEICHYLDEKLEKKAERIYDLRQHKTTLDKMKSFGIAVNAFDSSL